MVATGSAVGDLKTVQKFIDDYGKCLDAAEQEETLMLAQSHYYFAEKSYQKSLELLAVTSQKKISFALHVRTLQLKAIYEFHLQSDDYLDILESRCLSFQKYLIYKKNQISDERATFFNNFIKWLKKLAKYKYKKSVGLAQKENLIADLVKTPIISKAWLISKIMALK